MNFGVDQHDPYLWESIVGAFHQQFADRVKMCDGNIDDYIAKFDLLVNQAGYQADDPQILEKFVNGLPASLYETIYQLDEPTTYEGWQ